MTGLATEQHARFGFRLSCFRQALPLPPRNEVSKRGTAEGCVEETVARLPHIANGVRSL
jgi:hypothetical protein